MQLTIKIPDFAPLTLIRSTCPQVECIENLNIDLSCFLIVDKNLKRELICE